MSVLHKTMVWLGLVDDDEYYGEDDEYYADEYGEPISAPARQPARAAAAGTATVPPMTEPSPLTVIRSRRDRDDAANAPAVAAPRSSAVKPIPMPATRVHVMDPKGFNDAQEVGDRLKNGQPVILNLQGVDRELQRRLIDFASGLAYALNGTMSKAADQVFLLTPSNVEVSEEEKERLQARGLYRTARS
jgi:cell division inhibitor SepF